MQQRRLCAEHAQNNYKGRTMPLMTKNAAIDAAAKYR